MNRPLTRGVANPVPEDIFNALLQARFPDRRFARARPSQRTLFRPVDAARTRRCDGSEDRTGLHAEVRQDGAEDSRQDRDQDGADRHQHGERG